MNQDFIIFLLSFFAQMSDCTSSCLHFCLMKYSIKLLHIYTVRDIFRDITKTMALWRQTDTKTQSDTSLVSQGIYSCVCLCHTVLWIGALCLWTGGEESCGQPTGHPWGYWACRKVPSEIQTQAADSPPSAIVRVSSRLCMCHMSLRWLLQNIWLHCHKNIKSSNFMY